MGKLDVGKLGDNSDRVIQALLKTLSDKDNLVRTNVAKALSKLGKKSDKIKPLVVQWIEQHEDSEFVGSGIDALWELV